MFLTKILVILHYNNNKTIDGGIIYEAKTNCSNNRRK